MRLLTPLITTYDQLSECPENTSRLGPGEGAHWPKRGAKNFQKRDASGGGALAKA